MNQKHIGILLIVFATILGIVTGLAKQREDFYIKQFVMDQGTCYLDDGTCLHADRDITLYFVGWITAAAMAALGLYMIFFERSHQSIAKQNTEIAHALKQAKDVVTRKDRFQAFLAGFSNDEKKILSEIFEQDGIKQSTLRYRLGMSKATLSLILTDFEKREIITKKKSGKTNQLFLRKKF